MTEANHGSTEGRSSNKGESQFDFWLGYWQVTWDEDKQGTNRISKILDDRVIHEEFDGSPGLELRGRSFSVFDEQAGVWRQTWVDNSGGYLDFVGGWHGDRMVLSRQVPGDQGRVRQRMIWFDIEQDVLTWNWERSEDGGESWQLVWQLHYQRVNE